MAKALARRAAGFLERAGKTDWGGDGPPVLGVEVRSAAEVPGGGETITVRFRADRGDRLPGGALVLTDYKTGFVDSARQHSTRVRYVRQGKLLQGGVYALCRPAARGRYLLLKEDIEPSRRQVELDSAEAGEAIRTAVALAVDEILACLEAGTSFPRLDGAGSPCASCAVRLACLRDDSSYRRRVVEALEALDAGHPVRRLWDQRRARMPEGTE